MLFTEDDLPSEYYEEFAWAFPDSPHETTPAGKGDASVAGGGGVAGGSRRGGRGGGKGGGYWTWKPWILWNLTAPPNAQVRPGDVVLWVDSDLRLWTDQPQHLRTALCNMEHRNGDNVGGIFPFVRCRGHPERDYTKPGLFPMIRGGEGEAATAAAVGGGPLTNNATATTASTSVPYDDDRTEQVYAGVLGIHVRNDTAAFLQEWKDWGRVPFAFGNDRHWPTSSTSTSSSNESHTEAEARQQALQRRPVQPDSYGGHKNDQSVLSLMVKRHGMKTWPTPYLLLGESGIWTPGPCLRRFMDAGYCFFVDKGRREGTVCAPFNWWVATTTTRTRTTP
jgi:hypothetical protein